MEQILRLFPMRLRIQLQEAGIGVYMRETLEEIRLRVNQPIEFLTMEEDFFLKEKQWIKNPDRHCLSVSAEDLSQMSTLMSQYSLYAYEEEVRQGFLTVEGGHRIGVCGQVTQQGQKIQRIYPLLYMNIRLARERKGCGQSVYEQLWNEEIPQNTLLLSAPGAGKTTLLRDLIRLFSNGDKKHKGKRVGLVDERSEIAGCLHGIPQNDVGIRTDVLDGCPKVEGMMLLVRSMSPEILAVDEIGGLNDFVAMQYAIRCGCKLLATVHAESMEELFHKPGWDKCREEELFTRYVMISKEKGIRNYQVKKKNGKDVL